MADVTPAQAYAALRAAGFGPSVAVTLTAIGGAESGWNTAATGDVTLQDATWGPSVGVWQIRTQHAQTGTGGPRDINFLRTGLAAQAQAAHEIWASQGLGAWSTYSSGAYRTYLAPAEKVGGKGAQGVRIPPAVDLTATDTAGAEQVGLGGDLLNGVKAPLNWAGSLFGGLASGLGSAGAAVGSSVAGGLWAEIQPFALTAMFATAGLGLVVVGLVVTAKPAIVKGTETAEKIGGAAAMAA